MTDQIEAVWRHLPNAAVIDAVLADVNAGPRAWDVAWDALWDEPWDLAADIAWSVADAAERDAVRGAVRVATQDVGMSATWDTAEGTLVALIAWPSSADMLALTPDALRTIIATCDGAVKHQAVLLLPAVIAQSA